MKIQIKIKLLFNFLLVLVLFSNCRTVKSYVNKKYKPLSVQNQQIESLNINLTNIDSIKPNIGVRIGKTILENFLPGEINKLAKSSSDEKLLVHKFNSKINLEKQAIIVNADFEASILDLQVKLTGKMQGYVAIASRNDSIYFLPALKTLKINQVKFTEKKPKLSNRAIALLIKPVARNFLENLNRYLIKKTPAIYSRWSNTTKLNPNDLFSNDNTTLTGSELDVSRYLKNTSILIDKKGVSIMLELEKNIKEKDSINTISNVDQKNRLNKLYNNYYSKFSKLWLLNFEEYTENTKLSVGVTKPTLAGVFNDLFYNASLKIDHSINIPKRISKSDLEIERLKINCNSVRERFSFPDFKYSKSCKYSCMKRIRVRIGPFKVSKRIDDPFCLAARNACKIGRESARVAWQTARESARVAHQIYNEGRVAACKIAVEASELVDLGKIETSSEANGNANLNLSNITMSNDLSIMHLKSNGKVKLLLKSSLNIKPQDIGHLVLCAIDYKKNIKTKLEGTISTQFSTINFNPIREGENIILTGEVSPIGYKASTPLSPLHSLLSDPLLAANCPLLYTTLLSGGVLGGVAAVLGMIEDPKLQLLLKGSAVDSYKIEPFKQKLEPIVFKTNNGEEYKSKIIWGSNSINYTH